MQNVGQNDSSESTNEVRPVAVEGPNPTSASSTDMEKSQVLPTIPQNFITDLSPSDEEEVSEVESFILEQDLDSEAANAHQFLLAQENIEGADVRTVDPETQARLEALLEAAGIGKLSTADGKAFADPEVLRRLTSSVSCALDEAAAALTRMRAEQQGEVPAVEGTRSLAKACSNGDVGTVRQLLDEGRSVHETTEEGESLLSLACSAGYVELAQVLLAMRANVEDRGIKGDCTPLMEAASGGYVDIVRLLITHGADVNAQSSAGNTPLHYAACGGHEDVVRVLIDAGANVEEHNENGHTPLMEAASAGHVGVAKILLDAGAGINTHSNEFKESALTLACYKGHLSMVKFLLEAGADQEHKTDEMHTALMEASMDGHVEVARLLLDSGAQVNMPADSFESPLTLAACGGHVELANLLIERGANLEEVNDEGYTPLMEAAREGHEEMVALLLAHGADINAQTEETQETALTLACCGGFLEVTDFLIKAGADLELGCSTPLMEAAQEGHLELVRYLLKAGANVHAQTQTGDTALTYACENGHTDVAEVLLENGAELEHESEGGRTPLMKAARAGHLCTVQFLIGKGADVNRQTSTNDHTVLSLACAGGHLTVVQLLLRHGADPTHKLKDGSTMLIEAAKGGHTNVVNLLLDWPNPALSPSPDLNQLSPPQSSLDINELPRVPMQGLTNIVPPQDPEQIGVSCNNLSSVQTVLPDLPGVPQVPGQVNLKELNIPGRSVEQIRANMQKSLTKSRQPPPKGAGDVAMVPTQEVAPTAVLGLAEADADLGQELEKTLAEGSSSPLSVEGEERPDMKASERLEAFISKMMRKAELLNTTKEEQILKKQQILEELQKVEQELQEKAKAQLLLNAQAKLVEQEKARQQQLLSQQALQALTVSPPQGSLPLHVALKSQLEAKSKNNNSNTEGAAEEQAEGVCRDEALKGDLPDEEPRPSPGPECVGDDVDAERTAQLAKQESLSSSASSADSGCGNSETNGAGCESSQAEGIEEIEEVQADDEDEIDESSQEGDDEDDEDEDEEDDEDEDDEEEEEEEEEEDDEDELGLCAEVNGQRDDSRASSEEVDLTNVVPMLDSREQQLLQEQLRQEAQKQQQNKLLRDLDLIASITDMKKMNQPLNQQSLAALQQTLSSIPLPTVLESVAQQPNVSQAAANTLVHQLTLQHQLQQELQQLKLQQAQQTQIQGQKAPKQQGPQKQQAVTQQQQQQVIAVQQSVLQQQNITQNITVIEQPTSIAPGQGDAQDPNHLKLQQVQLHLQQLQQQLHHVQHLQTSQQLTQQELLEQAQQLQQHIQQAQHLQPLSPLHGKQQPGQVVVQTAAALSQQPQASTAQPLSHQQLLQDAQKLQQQLLQAQKIQQEAHLRQLDQQQQGQQVAVTGAVASGQAPGSSAQKRPKKKIPLLPHQQQQLQQLAQQQQQMAAQQQLPVQQALQQSQQQALQQQLQHQQQQQVVVNNQLNNQINNITTTGTAATGNNNSAIVDYYLDTLGGGTNAPVTPNPSPASPQISPPVYPTIDLDARTEGNHDTALTLACAGGHAELVSLLLSRGADIEHRDKKGFTPLILAATAGHADVVEILLDHGADLEAQSERTKDTPLSLACSGGRYEVVELLLARGANKEHRNVSDYTPLSLAASGGYVNIIKLLLSHGAEINSRTGSKLGISPLMLAAMNGHTAAVKLLLDMGSDINAQIETNRNTALTLACFQGRHEVVSLLVDRKANIEHRAKTGLTPLMEAASGGYVEVGRVLLDKGADVNATPVPSSRDTALTIAADKGHYRFVELLISRGASIDVKNKKGNSPLWLACNGGHLDVVQLLVNARADVDSQDNRKVSCLMSAFRKGHVKVVKWLVKHVTQFPSDQECMRYITTISDKELLKKCHQCMEIIRSAKDRQAAEANKAAATLLEQIDQERSREESKKAAAARRREKRRKKKKEKQEREKEQKEKDNDTGSKSSTPDLDGKDSETQSNQDREEEEEDEIPSKDEKPVPEPRPPVPTPATTVVNVAEPRGSNKRNARQTEPSPDTNTDNRADESAATKSRNKKNRRENREKNREAKERMAKSRSAVVTSTAAPKSAAPVSLIPSKAVVSSAVATVASIATNSGSISSPRVNTRKPAKDKENRHGHGVDSAKSRSGIGDLDDFGSLPSTLKIAATAKEDKRNSKTPEKNSRVNSLDTFGMPMLSPGKGLKSPAAPSPKKGGKKEEGWKEVVRKSKKVSVPSNAISRVIGRGGCNINAIRGVSGAHIEVDKPKGQGDRNITIKGSADATRQAHNLITALVKDPDKELDQIIPQLKNKVVTTNTLTMSTISMWNNMMANGIGTTANITTGVITSTTTNKSQGPVAKSTSTASVTQTATITSGRHAVTTAPRQESTLTNIGVWGAMSTTANRTTNGRATNASASGPNQSARSPGTVARQLFSERQSNGTVSTSTSRTNVTYSSPSMAKTKVVTASPAAVVSRVEARPPQSGGRQQQGAQKSANAQNQPGRQTQPQIPGLPPQNKGDPQPLPIKSTANAPGQSSGQAGPTGTGEYSPFNNFFSDVSGRVLGKKEDEGRMNFASVAAAGVVASSSSPMPAVPPALANARSQPNSESNYDPSLLAKAPGYKASGQQRTTSPQVSDDYMKAPGFKGQNYMSSLLGCGGGPVEIDGGGRVPGYQPMPGGSSHPHLMTGASEKDLPSRLVDYGRPGSSPSGANLSPRSATSNPAGINQSPRPGELPHPKDQYSTPHQPMTLPKIESNLNPNAPDFTSRSDRAIFQQLSLAEQQQILRAHLNAGMNQMNHQQSLQSSFNSNPNYNQLLQSRLGQADLSQSFGRSSHPGHMMGNQNYGDSGLPQGGAIGLGDLGGQGLPLGGFGGAGYGGVSGNETVMSTNSIPRQYSPMAGPAPARSSSATSSGGTASNKEEGSPVPPVSAESSPMSSSAPSPTDQARVMSGEDRRLIRPIGGERAKPKAPGQPFGMGEMGSASGIWGYGSDASGDWMSNSGPLVTPSTGSSAMSAGLSGDMGVDDRPTSHPPPPMGPLPQMMAGVFPLDPSVIDPALEQVLKNQSTILVPNSGVFAGGLPMGAALAVQPAMYAQATNPTDGVPNLWNPPPMKMHNTDTNSADPKLMWQSNWNPPSNM